MAIFTYQESSPRVTTTLSKVLGLFYLDFNIKAIISATLSAKVDKKVVEIDHYMHIPALDS
jgi:hypothetical protein